MVVQSAANEVFPEVSSTYQFLNAIGQFHTLKISRNSCCPLTKTTVIEQKKFFRWVYQSKLIILYLAEVYNDDWQLLINVAGQTSKKQINK